MSAWSRTFSVIIFSIFFFTINASGTISSQDSTITLFIFPSTCDTTQTDSSQNICEEIANFISEDFSSTNRFLLISPDSANKVTNLNITDYQNETQLTTALSKQLHVQVGIRLNITEANARIKIQLQAIELPSDILIHSSVAEISANDSTSVSIQEILKPILEEFSQKLLSKKTDLGYPFASEECGVLIMQDSDSTAEDGNLLNDLAQSLRSDCQSLQLEQTRFKSIAVQHDTSENPSKLTWQSIADISRKLNPCLLLWTNSDSANQDIRLVILTQTMAESLLVTSRLPFFPPTPELSISRFDSSSRELEKAIADLCFSTILLRLGKFEDAANHLFWANSMFNDAGDHFIATRFIASQIYHYKAYLESESNGNVDADLREADRQYSACLTELPSDSGVAAAWLYLNWADVRLRQRAWDDAIASLEKSRKLFSKNSHDREAALMSLRIADVLTAQKQWDKVEEICENSLPVLSDLGDSLAVSAALEKLAPIFELKNEPDSALAMYSRNANLNIAVGRLYDAARIYGHMGLLLRDQGDFDRALDCLQQELDIATQLQSEPALAKSHFHLGTLYHRVDSTTTAIAHFKEAYETMSMLGDTLGMARALNNIGAAYHSIGQAEEAKSSYQDALQLSQKNDDLENQIRSHSNLADLLAEQGRWDQAYLHYDEAINLAESYNNMRTAAMVSYSKGLAFVKNGRLRSGYNEIKKAIDMGGGTVYGNTEKEKEFLRQLEDLITEIEDIRK